MLLRAPRGAGRRTAVAFWSHQQLRAGRVVVWVDVAESDAVDSVALGRAIRTRLGHITDEVPEHDAISPGSVAATLDAHDALLVVDRLGAESGPGLVFVDQVASLLRRGGVVALTAMPLPGPVPTAHDWARDDRQARVSHLGRARDAADAVSGRTELTLRDLAVRADEAEAAAASLGTSVTRSQARFLVTATAGWAPLVYQALREICRASAGSGPVTDETVSSVTAAQRAAYVRGVLPEEAITVLVEAGLAPRFSRAELFATGLLAPLPAAGTFVDRLVATGLILDDPAGPDDVLALEPHTRRALLDYARGRDGEELSQRATKAARRRAQSGDARGALLVALESGDPELVRDLLQGLWTHVLDGHDATLHEVLWGAAASVPATHVPGELRALLSVTRRFPGRPGDLRFTPGRPPGNRRPDVGHTPDRLDGSEPKDPLATFIHVAGLRRAGRSDDALRAARCLLDTGGGPDVARLLVELQAALAAAETGLLDESLRRTETAYQVAVGAGALPLAAAAAELSALIHALDSGVRAAADWSAEATALPDPPAWWRQAVGDPAVLASALVQLEHLDADPPGPLLATARAAAGTDLWFAGLHTEVTLAALRRQEETAVDRLRDVLTQRGLAPSDGGRTDTGVRIPPLLALDLGLLLLAVGRGTQAVVVADALTTRTSAAALLDGHIHLAQGRAHDALRAVAPASPGATPGIRLQAHLLAACALAVVPDGDGVHRELSRAAALAHEVGGSLPYWWASPAVLRRVVDDAPAPVRERIEQVLYRRGEPAPVEFVVIPDRQLAVLHRLAEGLNATEVAKASFVSRNTVKTQIRELYRRLGVHDRTSALRRARELGLLDPMVRARLGADPADAPPSSPSRP
ncbi:LuxR C-terminal-related transcriptional regulator [Promicromonospora sp. MEB111]|uniref:LuxR C-terminal-related transcriptional regulator n=1 Tax=Promicromonospora sp. MEB111 TaxID=3040301 RepID=UPI00254EA992|nr:LuxR C-terminal-related transcriptional regulator [Promicromonospora sp. MEB111]